MSPERPSEERFKEWLRNLRSRRGWRLQCGATDLLTRSRTQIGISGRAPAIELSLGQCVALDLRPLPVAAIRNGNESFNCPRDSHSGNARQRCAISAGVGSPLRLGGSLTFRRLRQMRRYTVTPMIVTSSFGPCGWHQSRTAPNRLSTLAGNGCCRDATSDASIRSLVN
jgi:hypothetical protein